MLKLTQAQLEYLSTLKELPETEHPEDKCALIWVGGSHAYGIADEHSDVDVRAATMPTMRQILSLHDYGEKHMPDSDMVVRSYLKVARMLRDANPNMVELANLPIDCILHCDDYGFRLLQLAQKLAVNTKCKSTFSGYAYQQTMLAERREHEGNMSKAYKAMVHALRVYRMGAVLLESGEVQVSRVGIDQEELLAIRHGDFDPEQYDLKLLDAKSRFEEAAEHTRLPQPVSDTELQDMVLPIVHEYAKCLFKESEYQSTTSSKTEG